MAVIAQVIKHLFGFHQHSSCFFSLQGTFISLGRRVMKGLNLLHKPQTAHLATSDILIFLSYQKLTLYFLLAGISVLLILPFPAYHNLWAFGRWLLKIHACRFLYDLSVSVNWIMFNWRGDGFKIVSLMKQALSNVNEFLVLRGYRYLQQVF